MQEFKTKPDLQNAAAEWIAQRLEDPLSRRKKATLMLSGGSTPGPIYEKLSHFDIDWRHVTVGLADERWLEETSPASNSAMVRRTLLQNKAASALYTPMKLSGDDPFKSIEDVAKLYEPALRTDVMILGMGPDAHTLSWFSGARGYKSAIDPENPLAVTAVEAIQSPVTGEHTRRMTLTQRCVANARHILLIITGEEKKRVFETAATDAPVSIMHRAAGDALTVFYCP